MTSDSSPFATLVDRFRHLGPEAVQAHGVPALAGVGAGIAFAFLEPLMAIEERAGLPVRPATMHQRSSRKPRHHERMAHLTAVTSNIGNGHGRNQYKFNEGCRGCGHCSRGAYRSARRNSRLIPPKHSPVCSEAMLSDHLALRRATQWYWSLLKSCT